MKNFLRMSLEDAIVYIDELSELAKWDDRENMQYRHHQIKSVYDRDYSLISCEKLAKEGWCIGETCDLYGGV